MEIWKIVLYCILGAGILSVIIGLFIGKAIRNRKNPNYHSVLSKKEKIISTASVLLGIGIIAVGVFVPMFTNKSDVAEMSGINEKNPEGDTVEGDVWVGGKETVVIG